MTCPCGGFCTDPTYGDNHCARCGDEIPNIPGSAGEMRICDPCEKELDLELQGDANDTYTRPVDEVEIVRELGEREGCPRVLLRHKGQFFMATWGEMDDTREFETLVYPCNEHGEVPTGGWVEIAGGIDCTLDDAIDQMEGRKPFSLERNTLLHSRILTEREAGQPIDWDAPPLDDQ